jgi:hypothetical protein
MRDVDRDGLGKREVIGDDDEGKQDEITLHANAPTDLV